MTKTIGRFAAALLIALPLAGLMFSGALAGASTPVSSGYETYPDVANPAHGLTPGCTPQGITGVSFTNVTTGQTNANLQVLTINQDDLVTFSWTGNDPACNGTAPGLALKLSLEQTFDPTDNQVLTAWEPQGDVVFDGQAGSLSLVIDLPGEGNCFQLDAIIGAPLAIVGPAGSFYTAATRGDSGLTTLISAKNGNLTPGAVCVEVPVTSTTVPSSTTTTPTTSPPPTSTTPSSVVTTSTVPPSSTVVSTTAFGAQSAQVAAAQVQRIPATGGDTSGPLLLAILLITVGVTLTAAARRHALRHAVR